MEVRSETEVRMMRRVEDLEEQFRRIQSEAQRQIDEHPKDLDFTVLMGWFRAVAKAALGMT